MSDISKFGDVLVNFLYSAARLKATGEHDGIKVSNHVLMQALNKSTLVSPPRKDKHEKGDFVEETVARAWQTLFTTEEMIDILCDSIKGKDLSDRQSEIEAEIEAFSTLIDKIGAYLTP
ncbi:MAG: ribonuclease III family protein [Candidatus Methanofastidiosia archaeon]